MIDGFVETETKSGEILRLYESDLEMEWGLLEIEKGENSIEVNLDDLIQFFYNNGLEVKPMKMSV